MRIVRFFISIFLFFIFCFSSCKIPTHWKSDKGKKCELHHLTLHRSIVRITYGFICNPGSRLGIGSENFPNAKHPQCGGCTVRPNKIVFMYSCSKCNTLKRKNLFKFKTKEERKEQEIRTKF